MKITVEIAIAAAAENVWSAWTTPGDIVRWNAASEDWQTTNASVDLRVGGRFSSRMEARDGSVGFDFCGMFTRVEPPRVIEFRLDDGRVVQVEFIAREHGVTVRETFEAEQDFSTEQQRQGWQAILENFARYVEGGG
ncbi:MAG: ATPase [Proteobacteria bacterium]|nr:MAG: ATPase [Pseudomonadota bacterium]